MSNLPGPFSISFRPMKLADVEKVHEIDTLSFSLPWSERSYRFELTENRHSIVLVADASWPEVAAKVVGMIVIWVILDEAHVATLAIHPDFRGSGTGRRLLARGLIAAYERGARLSYLEVRRGNIPAQRLYEKFRFQVVGERPRYYKDNNEDALLMTLDCLQMDRLQALSM
jgi:ribosomal-protein-alanine N-acetyltransferase